MKDIFKKAIQGMLEGEFDAHMEYKKSDNQVEKSNYRNGYNSKKVRSDYGEFNINVPRDRNTEFNPIIVSKNSHNVKSTIEEKILMLYAKGLSTRDISDMIRDFYGVEYFAEMISNITNNISDVILEWQKRPLERVYSIVFIDAIHYSVRQENTVVKKAIYVVLAINSNGFKEILGLYIGENESSKYWLYVLNDLKNRGIKNILILCSDALTGINEAIITAFPNTMQQKCIVYIIRNSTKLVSYKHLKEFCNDLKTIYQESNIDDAYSNLQIVKNKWNKHYLSSLKVWENHWENIVTMFNFSKEIRSIIYTTNYIENLNRAYRNKSCIS